jgi:DNA repair protein RecN (Recombination protein N)
MLTDLKIENFAIIDKLEICFNSGFNVLTGESGAGKSLIVDSLNFVLGERLKNERIDIGKTVQVQARFEIGEDKTPDFLIPLTASGIVENNGRELILARKMQPSGKNIYYINGEMVPFKTYRSVSENLVDIHGQRDTHLLLSSSHQRTLLDLLGGEESGVLLGEI